MLVALLGAALVVLRWQFNGRNLADLVEGQLNARISGKVEIGSIRWELSSLPVAVTGGWFAVEIEDLKVFEAKQDGGALVLSAPRATAEIDAHPAMFGRHDLIVRNIRLPEGGKALIREVSNPTPVHEYDTTTVSLTAAFEPPRVQAFRAGISAGSAPVFDLWNYSAQDVDLTFVFPEFTAEVRGARVGTYVREGEGDQREGTLRFAGSDPMARSLYFSLAPTADEGTLTIGPVGFELRDVVVERLAQVPTRWPRDNVPHGLEYRATGVTTDGARVEVQGLLARTWLDLYGGEHEVTVTVTEADGLARRLSNDLVSGAEASARLVVSGPVIAPRMELDLRRFDLELAPGRSPMTGAVDEELAQLPPLALHLDRARAVFDRATDSGYLEDTVATGAGGEVHLSATLNLAPLSFDLQVDIPKPLDLAPYLPDRVRQLTGGALSGGLHAFGTGHIQRLDQLDLRLGNARVTGKAYRTEDGRIHADGLEVALGRTRVTRMRGVIDTAAGQLENVVFAVESTDLSRWLARAGAPPLARRVTGSGRLHGKLSDPRANATLTLAGVPVVDRVVTQLDYKDRALNVSRAESGALGGSLHGSGTLLLGPRPRLVDVRATGRDLDLSRLPGSAGLLRGTLSLDASASGAVTGPKASATGKVTGLELAGDAFEDTEITYTSEPDGRQGLALELVRKAGGVLSAHAVLGARGDLDGAVSLRKLPIESLTALGGGMGKGKGHAEVGGRIDAELQLSGTAAAPTADGRVQIGRTWFRDTFLGSAGLDIERVGPGQLRVSGSLFQGKVEVDGIVSTRAPFRGDVTLILRRVEIDHLFPELATRHGARGWVSGEVKWRGAMSLAPGMRPEVSAVFTEAVVLFDSEDTAGRPAPIRLASASPMSLVFDGRTVRLREPVVVAGPAGDFTLTGAGGLDGLDFQLQGAVSVGMLGPYLKRYFDEVAGTLDMSVRVTGQAEAPRVTGTVEISKVMVKPAGQDARVRIPSGKVEFGNDQLTVTGLSMVVIDEWSEDHSELSVAGGVKLQDFRPVRWALDVSGQLSGKMLLVVAPTVFSAATGSADLFLALGGEGRAPNIDGEIVFDDESPLAIIPRGLRREIALTGGAIKFTDKLVELDRVMGWIDDEGELADISGEISLEDWRPVDVDVSVTANDLPFRIPQTLELAVNARGLRVVGGMDTGLEVTGVLEIVRGDYIKRFQPFLDALKPERSTEAQNPIWEEVPLVGNARLDLLVETRAFFVKNNVADIEMNGEVAIRGTPRQPRLDGVIRVEHGSFKFQGVRARFERTRGTVNFSPYGRLPETTPTLDIRTESDYQDISGQQHNIQLTLRGPLGQLDWDLATSTGLNKAQTFTLIFAGRTPDETRAVLGDEPIGSTGIGSTAATGTTTGSLAVADQLLKQFAGEYFSLLMEEEIKSVTGLDVARLEVGTASIGFHGEKKIAPPVRVITDFERSLSGWSWDARSEYRLNDSVSVEGTWLRKQYDDEAEEDVNEGTVRLKWRKVLLP